MYSNYYAICGVVAVVLSARQKVGEEVFHSSNPTVPSHIYSACPEQQVQHIVHGNHQPPIIHLSNIYQKPGYNRQQTSVCVEAISSCAPTDPVHDEADDAALSHLII